MKDKNGAEINVGDEVTVKGKIVKTVEGQAMVNMVIETSEPLHDGGTRQQLSVNNNQVVKVALAMLALLAALTLFGCATNAAGKKHLDMAVVCPALQVTTSLGTTAALTYNPALRPEFVAARDGLRVFVQTSQGQPVTMDELSFVLSKIPVKNLKGDGTNAQSALIIGQSGIALFNLVNGEIAKLDKNGVQTNDVIPCASCILTGLDSALGP